MIDIILIAVVVICLALLVAVISRKLPALTRTSRTSLKNHREVDVKERLVVQRLERKFYHIQAVYTRTLLPLLQRLALGMRRMYQRVVELENQYRHRAEHIHLNEQSTVNQGNVFALMAEVTELMQEQNFDEAEKRLVSLISLDPSQPDSYRKLADLYLETKDFEHARETLIFLIDLRKKKQIDREVIDGSDHIQLATDYIDLGIVCRELTDMDGAVRNIEQAARLDRNNPKILDMLLDISLLAKNKILAWEAYDRLKEANPENQKLQDFSERLQELERDIDKQVHHG